MIKIAKKETGRDGDTWRGQNLAGNDNGTTAMKMFTKSHPHDGWRVTIFDTKYRESFMCECGMEEVPEIVSRKYQECEAVKISRISESKRYHSYTVYMEYGDEYFQKQNEEEDMEELDKIIEEEFIGQSFSNLIESEA